LLRLKRWAGGWGREDHEKVTVDGRETDISESELTRLAKEAVANPALLSSELISWLLSAAAQKSNDYFFFLGKEDTQRSLRATIEAIGSQAGGANAFPAYWGGWATSDRIQAEKRLLDLAGSNAVTSEAFVRAARYLGPTELLFNALRERVSNGSISPTLASSILYGDWLRTLSDQALFEMLKSMAGTDYENAALIIDVIEQWSHDGPSIRRDLLELAWRCLEATPIVTSREEYSCQQLAARLAESDSERGFRLLEKLLMQPYGKQVCNPIDRYGARENRFWKVLHEADPERAIRIVLSQALVDPVGRFRVTWDFKDVLDQEKDAGLLIKIAGENEKLAEVIAETMTTARPGFWPMAFKLIETYPGNESIQSALTGGIEQQGTAHIGSHSQHLESCRSEMERVLSDSKTPSKVRVWLADVLSRMEGEIARNVIWEYDEDANDLRRYIEDRDSPERIWAIARVLKYADWKDIKRMLTVEDIEEALPQVDLPERKRKALEKALEVWRVGS
jgi:hypothetical protein